MTGLAFAPLILLVVAPIGVFLIYSLFSVESGQIIQKISLTNYSRFFSSPSYLRVFGLTLLVGAAVALISVTLSYPVALLISTLGNRGKAILTMLLLVPLFMSYVIKIYSIRAILGQNGFLNQFLIGIGLIERPLDFFVFNLNAVLLAQCMVILPFATLPILLSLERIPRSVIEASADLGASNWQTFYAVMLPLSMPAVIGSFSFVFILSVGDFLTPEMVGGKSGFTFGRVIFSQFGVAFNWPFGAALSVVLVATVVIVIASAMRLGARWQER